MIGGVETGGGDDMADLVVVSVNQQVCIGAGQCEMHEEATFLLDEDTGIAAVVGHAMLARDRARKVMDTCPSQAISIAETAP